MAAVGGCAAGLRRYAVVESPPNEGQPDHRLIEYQTQCSRFVAVIQNEIGEVGLDGKLLDYTITEIDEGCVCCSLVGNLKRAVNGILSSFQPDYIILETTGVAKPPQPA